MVGRNWDALVLDNLYNIECKTLQGIGDIYGVTRERVRQVMKEFGIKRTRKWVHRGTKAYNNINDYILACSLNGKEPTKSLLGNLIDKRCCFMCKSANGKLHIHHYCYPPRSISDLIVLCPSCHQILHRTKLFYKEQMEIYRSYLLGKSTLDLSKEHNVSRPLIYNIIRKIKLGLPNYNEYSKRKRVKVLTSSY